MCHILMLRKRMGSMSVFRLYSSGLGRGTLTLDGIMNLHNYIERMIKIKMQNLKKKTLQQTTYCRALLY